MSPPADKENENSTVRLRSDQPAGRQPFTSKAPLCPNLQGQSESEQRWRDGQQPFEEKIGAGGGADAVQTWCDYAAWAAEWKTEGLDFEHQGKVILERACSTLSADQRHKADVRLLRLWVRHANNAEEAEKIFEDLEKKEIGIGHALLYEAWAASSEKKRCFDVTEDVYQRGLRREAQPLDRLQSRYHDFQKRQHRRAKRQRPTVAEPSPVPSSTVEAAVPAAMLRDERPCIPIEMPTRSVAKSGRASHEAPKEKVVASPKSPSPRRQKAPASPVVEAREPKHESQAVVEMAPLGDYLAELCGESIMLPINDASATVSEGFASRSAFESGLSDKPVFKWLASNSAAASSGGASFGAHALREADASDADRLRDPHTWRFPEKLQFFESGETQSPSNAEHVEEEPSSPAEKGRMAWNLTMPETTPAAEVEEPSSPAEKASMAWSLTMPETTPAAEASEAQACQTPLPSGSPQKQFADLARPSTGDASRPSTGVLEFGPRDSISEHSGKSKRTRSVSSCKLVSADELRANGGEDVSVEELRAEWMLRKTQAGHANEAVASDAACSSTAFRSEPAFCGSSNRNAAPASSAGVDAYSNKDYAERTQEITTSCIAALLQEPDTHSSRPSVASTSYTGLDEPTYTMQEAQREVLGFFSSDSPKADPTGAYMTADREDLDIDTLPLGVDSHSFLGLSSLELNSSSNIVPLSPSANRQDTSAQNSSGFEVFQDDDLS